MTQMILQHESPPENRTGILATGLEPRNPNEDPRWYLRQEQPVGVYGVPLENDSDWFFYGSYDVYQFAYVGPMANDQVIRGAVVVAEPVPANSIKLLRKGTI